MLIIFRKTSVLMLHTYQIIFSLLYICLLLILLAFSIINAKSRAAMYYMIKIVYLLQHNTLNKSLQIRLKVA